MAPRQRRTRIYWRARGSEPRAYGDFRDFADVGGGLEALTPPDGKQATTDPDLANALVSARLAELQRFRRNKVLLGLSPSRSLGAVIHEYLAEMEHSRASRHVLNVRVQLGAAGQFFDAGRMLDSITVRDVRLYLGWLRHRKGRGGNLAPATLRHYLVALSGLFTYAESMEIVPPGHNPVRALKDKPSPGQTEAAWLEHDAACTYLEAARRTELAIPIHEIVAAFLLTGGRSAEVLGLEAQDVSLVRRTVRFRENVWRRLKNGGADRTVALWPQLAEIIGERVVDTKALLFAVDGGMVRDLRSALDRVSLAAQTLWLDVHDDPHPFFVVGGIRTRIFRHTYTAARLQTTDRGDPVAVWTVAKELGHRSTERVERVYGHLGEVRHRSEFVEFRWPG